MTNRFRRAAIVITLVALAGCETSPTATEADYGNSVRAMVRNQTLNPGPADDVPPNTGDGVRIENALDAYRKDVAQPEHVNQDIRIGVNDTSNVSSSGR